MFKAIRAGIADGYSQPYEFNFGMSYDSDRIQRVYDVASIWGQRVGRIADVWNINGEIVFSKNMTI